MGYYQRGKRRRSRKDFSWGTRIIAGFIIGLLAWAFIPGLGPDLAGLSQKGAPKMGLPNWGKNADQILSESVQTDLVKAIADLPEGEWESASPYQRSQFGIRWADIDHNGCDTRNDILRRDLSQVRTKAGTHNCLVLSGEFTEPYTGRFQQFRKGADTSSKIQIDHVVALSNAWKTGASKWDAKSREQFANDPLNLLAVDGPANQDKQDKDAASWLPPNPGFHCQYVALQTAIKQKWKLLVTPQEKRALATVAASCPTQPLPTG
ncbi:HNH endonuclease family protein [Varibaculum vaginae]|uniref:HNH endonuclease family protein n=1 Tax=Varibaculum vaginae TaxID=2364797 RepID=UPI000F08CC53|nr:HNH endonuclease family protein [Varibaculum vaginae]